MGGGKSYHIFIVYFGVNFQHVSIGNEVLVVIFSKNSSLGDFRIYRDLPILNGCIDHDFSCYLSYFF